MPRRPRAEFEVTAVDRATRVLKNIERQVGGVSGAAKGLGLALVGFAGARGVSDLVAVTDQFTQLQNRVEFLTRATGSFDQTYSGLLQTALDTGGELETQINALQAIDRVREKYNLLDEQIIVINSNLQKLGAIGQTSLEAQARAQFQLSQFFNEGILRAEEYNSIIDQAPEIIALLERELGTADRSFRQLVLNGEIFANDVIRVLLENTGEIDARFQQIPSNLDRAFNVLETSIGGALAELDDATGATSRLAREVEAFARGVRNATGTGTDLDEVLEEIAETETDLERATIQLAEATRLASEEGLVGFISNLLVSDDAAEQLEQRIAVLSEKLAGLRDQQDALNNTTDVDTSNISTERPESENQKRAETARLNREARERARRIEFAAEIAQLEFETRDQAERQLFEFDLLRAQGFADEEAAIRAEREAQLFAAKLERRRAEQEEELALELGFKSLRDQQLQELEEEHQRQLILARNRGNKIAQKAVIDARKFEEAQGAAKVNFLLAVTAQLTQGLATQSRAAFNINKAASIAEAVINTATGITKALARQDYAGAAFTAAYGAAQIATISSTDFGGASSGATGFGAGSGVPSLAGESPLREIPVVTEEDANRQLIELRITGEGAIARAIIDDIQAEVAEGDALLITDRSRQALDLDSRI